MKVLGRYSYFYQCMYKYLNSSFSTYGVGIDTFHFRIWNQIPMTFFLVLLNKDMMIVSKICKAASVKVDIYP